jgi:hypothetical protein
MTSLEEAREKIAEALPEIACYTCTIPVDKRKCSRQTSGYCSYQIKLADNILSLPLISGLSIRQLCEMKGELLTDEEMKATKPDVPMCEVKEVDCDSCSGRCRGIARAQLLKCHLHQSAHDAQVRRETAGKIFDVYDGYTKALGDEINDISTLAYIHHWRSHRVKEGEEYRSKIAALRDKYIKGE